MEPKDMTNDQLVGIVENPQLCFVEHEFELLRRLNEADALRKENEELRKDRARLDAIDNLPKGAAFVMAIDAGGKTYIVADSSRPVRESIDAWIAKESEASHDR